MISPRSLLLTAFAAGLLAGSGRAAVETYTIDPVHSAVAFNIRHFFSKVPGNFTKFEGAISVDRDHLDQSSVSATIQAASVDTRNEKRDAHLRSPDFFAVEQFPTITFKSKSWKQTGEDSFDVTGDLTIKDVTKEVVLKVKSLGFGPGMRPGSKLSGWSGTTTINRRDFGVNGPAMLGKAVGDEVEISLDVEAGVKA